MSAGAVQLQRTAYVLLCVASLLWATNMVIGRGIRGELPPVAASFWRWTIAFVLVLPFTASELWERRQDILASWKVMALVGFMGVTVFNTVCYIGLTMTTATNGTLFNSIVPVFIPPIAWLLLRERTSAGQMAGIFTSLAGVVVIVAKGSWQTLVSLAFNRGDVLLVLAMILWAFYTVTLRFRPAGMSMYAFLATICIFGWPPLLAWYLWEVSTGATFALTLRTGAALAYFGIFPALVAFVCYNRGVAAVGPTRAGVFVHLVPVFGFVLSTVFLDEPPQGFHFIGMALIFTGIVITTRLRPAARA
jgi:drug/metabolite transporter (DMT)-like permease